MSDIKGSGDREHNVSMISREKLDINGVIDVLDFDNTCVNIKTCMGVLSVEGTDIKIVSLSKDSGKIYIEGKFDNLFYYNGAEEKRNGIFRRRGK